ncbi:MAG TPA: hypothetical protein ENJ80_08340, partial [Gammaproteobacteria bacterium]|nr:hypothetical protein [Gammaproteobacteria bacterium]
MGSAVSHDGGDSSGMPVLLEANYMVADAMNTPFASAPGPGRVVEMNIFTGERGVTLSSPFIAGNDGSAVCDSGNSDDDEGKSRRRGHYREHKRAG